MIKKCELNIYRGIAKDGWVERRQRRLNPEWAVGKVY